MYWNVAHACNISLYNCIQFFVFLCISVFRLYKKSTYFWITPRTNRITTSRIYIELMRSYIYKANDKVSANFSPFLVRIWDRKCFITFVHVCRLDTIILKSTVMQYNCCGWSDKRHFQKIKTQARQGNNTWHALSINAKCRKTKDRKYQSAPITAYLHFFGFSCIKTV